MAQTIVVSETTDSLASAAARKVVAIVVEAIAAKGQASIALAGGTTPGATYRKLVSGANPLLSDWSRASLFFGDERFVPLDDPVSNYRMVRENLLEQISLPLGGVHPVPTHLPSSDDAAKAYEAELRAWFEARDPDGFPSFDLVLLGMGKDGHTASLFPGASSLEEERKWVVASPPGQLPPPVDRVTLTLPVLNAAKHVLFLVCGADKADAVKAALDSDTRVSDCPAAGVRPVRGSVTWFLDLPAAAELS